MKQTKTTDTTTPNMVGCGCTINETTDLGTAIVKAEFAATLCPPYGAPELLPIGTACSIAEARQVIASDQAWRRNLKATFAKGEATPATPISYKLFARDAEGTFRVVLEVGA